MILTLLAARAAAKRALLYLAKEVKEPSEATGDQCSRRADTKSGDSANQVGIVGRPVVLPELSLKESRTGK